MAAPVDTNNEGDGESHMDDWLKQNRLTKIRDTFKQMEVIYEDLIDLSSTSIDDLNAYARDTLGLDIMGASRFAKAVSTLKPNKKKERIVLSAEEGDAIDNIDKRQKETDARINEATNDINTLTQVAKDNEDEVNAVRKEAVTALNKRFDNLISQYNAERAKKEEMIVKHVEALKAYNGALIGANSKCDELLEDSAMDKGKRKREIVCVSRDVLKTQIKDINMAPKVKIDVDKNEILQYISRIGSVNGYVYPQPPRMAVDNVESTSATVRLMMSEIETNYECAGLM
eukprot:107391_1